jgi:hypothetical protein
MSQVVKEAFIEVHCDRLSDYLWDLIFPFNRETPYKSCIIQALDWP